MRISRQAMFMDIAKVVAKRATCFRLNVGAVAVAENRIVSIGYNGSPPGEPHCTGHTCAGASQCNQTIHAEVNALNHVPAQFKDGDIDLDLYVTDSPCPYCANVIHEDGRVRRVFFATPYRITLGLDVLVEAGIQVYRVLPAGYVINWKTQQLVSEDLL